MFNAIYPTPAVQNDPKLERTYFAVKSHKNFWWYFNYNQQLLAVVARMRMKEELRWLMFDSDMNIQKQLSFDKMMISEMQKKNKSGAGWFAMPFGMYGVTVNEMMLQSYDNVIRVFPALIPDFDKSDVEVRFKDLAAFGGFKVSAVRQGGRTRKIVVKTIKTSDCKFEMPLEWNNAVIKEGGRKTINYSSSEQTVRINAKPTIAKIITFKAVKGKSYFITERN